MTEQRGRGQGQGLALEKRALAFRMTASHRGRERVPRDLETVTRSPVHL